jgi:hypothetical protein
MASKSKAAKAGAGVFAAGQAAKDNVYVQRLVEDEELRDNLRTAYESTRKAYGRINGKGPVKAITEDKKTQKELKEAATALRDAADALRGSKRKRSGGRGRLLIVAVIGAGLALALSEGLRKKVLDALFGAEEEFDFSANGGSAASAPAGQTVGAA